MASHHTDGGDFGQPEGLAGVSKQTLAFGELSLDGLDELERKPDRRHGLGAKVLGLGADQLGTLNPDLGMWRSAPRLPGGDGSRNR